MNKQLSVSIVIPNWNGAALLQKNLPEVIRSSQNAEIIVCDDASTDNSLEILRNKFPTVKIVSSPVQRGFAGNINLGVSNATGDIIILLNTDVVPEKDFLKPLIEKFNDNKTFAVGCLEISHEKSGDVKRGRGIAHWDKGYYIHARGEVNKTDTAWVSGGSGAFRKSIWDKLGGMDTIYNPYYWEDIDLSYRAVKAGYQIYFDPKSIVHHFHDKGNIKTTYSSTQIKQIAYRNQFIFHWKNISGVNTILAHIFWTPIRLLQALFHRDYEMLTGFFMAIMKFI